MSASDTPAAPPRPLPEPVQGVLVLAFAGLTALAISALHRPGLPRLELLLGASSLAALATSLLWVVVLGVRRGGAWAWLMGLGVWVPYVNLVLASVYVRRFWNEDGRGPGWLVGLSLALQLALSLRVVVAHHPIPI